MQRRPSKHLGTLISLGLFTVALIVIYLRLRQYHLRDIITELGHIRPSALGWAIFLTLLNYLGLTLYDALALHYINRRLPYRQVMLGSLIGYVFSNNTTILGGSAARYRIYSAMGLTVGELARLVAFCAFTFWLGFLTIGGLVFLLIPTQLPTSVHWPIGSVRLVGILFLVLVTTYLGLVLWRKKPLRWRTWEFPTPSWGVSIGQLGIACLDWLLTGAILFVLLPPDVQISFPLCLSLFLLAQTAGLLSAVPGGLGVFESAMLVLMNGWVEPHMLISSLLLLRLIYYILPLVRNSIRTQAHLALLGDKSFLFNSTRDTFIMYAVEGRSWIALGDPVGPPEQWQDLLWQFRELCDRYGGWPVFYQVDTESLDQYIKLGLNFIKLGEEAKVDLSTFSLEGSTRRDLRSARNKLSKVGYIFQIQPPPLTEDLLGQLRTISDAWLKDKNTREKGFSLGFFQPNYLRRGPLALVRHNDQIVAFANILEGAEREELSVDLVRYQPDGLHGIMDYLLVELLLWGQTQGYRWFNFGMAPLSGLEDNDLAPFWSQAGAYVFRMGEHFYNFQGLRAYKEKSSPVWRSKYLACPRGMALPRILTNLATLTSGSLRGIITK